MWLCVYSYAVKNTQGILVDRQTQHPPALLKHKAFYHHIRNENLQLLRGKARKALLDLGIGTSGLTKKVNGTGRASQSKSLVLGALAAPTNEEKVSSITIAQQGRRRVLEALAVILPLPLNK